MENYHKLLQRILDEGESHDDRTGRGTISLFEDVTFVHDMRMGFPLVTTKRLPPRLIFEELRWMLHGRSDVAWLHEAGVHYWDEWATEETCAKHGREAGDFGHIYGPLWRNFDGSTPIPSGSLIHSHCTPPAKHVHGCGYGDNMFGNDQLLALYHDLETNPYSRRLIVTGWHPRYQRQVELPPCHTLWQLKVHPRNEEISLHLYCRSIDMFLGMPFDIVLYAYLLELIAWTTNRRPRKLVITIGDAHIYSNHTEAVRLQLARSPYPLPRSEIHIGKHGLSSLLACKWEHFNIVGYRYHPHIPAEVAV